MTMARAIDGFASTVRERENDGLSWSRPRELGGTKIRSHGEVRAIESGESSLLSVARAERLHGG